MPFGKNARVLRDIKARKEVNASEVMRRAYIYVARNETLPAQVRYQAQLQLNNFSKYQRPTTVKNRCTETGKGRGILSKWGLCRVSARAPSDSIERPTYLLNPVVPIQAEGAGRRTSGRDESQLVMFLPSMSPKVTCARRTFAERFS